MKRETRLINNELYVGHLIWNRLRYIEEPLIGKRVSRLNPERERLIREAPELWIVDDRLWPARLWPALLER